MYDEDENVRSNDDNLDEDLDMEGMHEVGFEAEEEDSYDPEDKYH